MNQVCVALDLETTGVRLDQDEIIEVAAVKFQGDRVLGKLQTLVNPHCAVPLRTERLTGITQAEVDSAPSLSEVAGRLISFVRDHPIVGQSVPHDLQFLARKGVALTNLTYDTFDLASILLPELNDYTLVAVARHLGVPFDVHHRALADALASKDVFLALCNKAVALNPIVIAEISRLLAQTDTPLREFFQQLEREKSRESFSNSIAAQLATKMGLEGTNLDFLSRGSRREQTLVAREEIQPLDEDATAALLAEGGPFARTLPGYEQRAEQVEMLRAVVRTLNDGGQLLVEAGTGIGKSLAYLLPALLFSLQNDARVVISTNTINLQEQLIGKDIPDLRHCLEEREPQRGRERRAASRRSESAWKAALVKGRSNYICLRRWGQLRRSESLSLDEIKVLIRILAWLPSTKTGDRSELNLGVGESAVWPRICAQVESCAGAACPYFQRGTCFFYRARWDAESAHLVVVNHALLLSDLAANHKVLPEYDYLIIDEAHHLEDEATQQLGFEVSEHRVRDYLARLYEAEGAPGRYEFLGEFRHHLRGSALPPSGRRELDDTVAQLYGEVDRARGRSRELFQALGAFVRSRSQESGEYDRRVRLTHAVRLQPAWANVEDAAENLALAIGSVCEGLGRLQAALEGLSDAQILEYDSLMADLGALLHQGQEMRQQLTAVMHPDPSLVYWTAVDAQSGRVTLCAAPLQVGSVLQESLFKAKRATVVTSATLTTQGHFRYVREQLGLPDADELALGSPFDYRRATMLLVAEDIPEPNRPGYQRALENIIADVSRAAQGRTLALFTSRSSVRSTHAAIQPVLEKESILVLGHGLDGSRKQLLATFKSTPRTVLLGTSSFWEGIDVVGDALSVLVIAKLPFSVPSDPIFAARSELYENAFHEYAVPQAILRFKQGFGRLIRSRSDRGVVIVLDRRVQSKAYGGTFLQSLPTCTVRTCSARQMATQVRGWLNGAQNGERMPDC